ncbi:hypothetical protein SISSUDRAFT_1054019 [Sistotremastrum suecicum HHB10207 ss-3]|uniref:F-box domain-containing protein n=1 Tax=Sistotremastrum suecicum HHB10207 ss-3 TaxID=1314776 RepID=A0A165YTZ6_9AGAM|nr:hypothetical protein SISSUDRAFT_1054019 [Sistotremastrum suecicum HHB10207 ss-3]
MTSKEVADASRMSISQLSELLVARMWEEHVGAVSDDHPSRSAEERVRKALQLDEERVSCLESIRHCVADIGAQTRRFSNQQSLLLRMPEEIILNIFQTYLHAEYSNSGWQIDVGHTPIPFHSFQRLTKLLTITHISSDLRLLCKHSATLWMDLDLFWPPALIETFVERAQSASLTLTLPVSLGWGPRFASISRRMLDFLPHFLIQNLHRLRELRLRLPNWEGSRTFDYQMIWDAIQSSPAPVLEVFEFTTSIAVGPFQPDQLFLNTAPLLRDIELERCWNQTQDLGAFACLVSLSLDLSDSALIMGQLRELPAALARCPNLEDLRVLGSSGTTEPLAPAIRPMAELRCCVSLIMGELMNDAIIYLLSAVSFPLLRRVSLQGTARSRSTFPHVHSAIPKSLRSQCSGVSKVEFDLQDGRVGAEMTAPDSCSVYVAEERNRFSASTIKELLAAPSRILQIRPRYLSFSGEDTENLSEELYSEQTWMDMLSSYPSARRISISGNIALASFLAVLNSPEMYCPGLRVMNVAITDRVRDQDWDAIETLLRLRPNLREVIVDEREVSEQSDSE